jgi:peptidoglycan hydrolase-like protein with peptidoglycan-binding domain
MKKDDAMMMKKDEVMMKKTVDTMMKKEDSMMKDTGVMSTGSNLSLGSKGAEVTTLQIFLESKGLLVMPAGVAKGYFGPLTKAALIAYQASVDVPATGYYGPITRGVMSKMMMEKKGDTMMKKDEAMMNKDDAMMKKGDAMMEKKTQ